MWCHSQAILLANFESLSSGVRPCIVRMNNETRARFIWAILEKRLQDHIDVIAGIKLLTFWKRIDKMETLWISHDCNHHFVVPNHIFHLSGGGWLAWTQTISWLVDKLKHDSSKVIIFCQPLSCTDSQSLSNLFDRSTRIYHCVSVRQWWTQCKCLTTNPKDPVRRRQTVARGMHVECTWNARGMHVDFASSRTDENGVSFKAWRIVLSITFGGVWMPLRVLRSAARRAQVEHHRRVCDCIGAEYLHKFIMDRLSRKVLPVEIEIKGALIYCAVC
jgi:hypothetical protein